MFQKLARVLPFAAVIVVGCTPPSGEWRQPSMEYLNQKTPIDQRYAPDKSYSREALISFYTECLNITPYDIPDRVNRMNDKEFDRQVAACTAVKIGDPSSIKQVRHKVLQERAQDDAKLKRAYDKL